METEDPMKPRIGIFFALVLGATLGMLGGHIVVAQQATEQRTVLLASNLAGIEGYEVRMWRTDIGPGVVRAKHYHRERSAFTSSKVL